MYTTEPQVWPARFSIGTPEEGVKRRRRGRRVSGLNILMREDLGNLTECFLS